MTEQEEWEFYDQIVEEFGRMRPFHGKRTLVKKDGIYELDTNFNPPKVKKIEPKERKQ